MLNAGLLDSRAAPTLNNGPLTNETNYALVFQVTTDCWLRSLRWYRVATGSTNDIAQLRLYDASGPTTIFTASPLVDDNTVGWQESFCNVDVPLVAGHEYRVAACVPASHRFAYWDSSTPSTPPSPFTFVTPYRRYHEGDCTYPSTDGGTTYQEAVEARVRDTPPSGAGGGLTTTDLEDKFVAWLGEGETSEPTSSSINNVARLTGLLSVLNTSTVTSEMGLRLDVRSVMSTLSTLGTAIGDIATIVSAIQALLTSLAGSSPSSTVYTRLSAIDSALATLTSAVGTRDPQPAPLPVSYDLIDETDFSGAFLYPFPADMFILTITDPLPDAVIVDVDGVDWLPRFGWWSPYAEGVAGDRRFIEFTSQELRVPGEQMDGVLLFVRPGVAGHIAAYTRA